MMRGCLFGYGRAGRIHYENLINENLINNDKINLKYIFETRERLSEVYNEINNKDISLTSRLNIILTDTEIDFCIICTPTNTHYELIKACLSHNKHVMCEKPLSEDESEIKECYNLAASNNLVLLCALNRIFDPQIAGLKDKLHTVGGIHQINTISKDYPYPSYNYLKHSSGIFADCAVHDIFFINWILDDIPINVFVTGNVVMPEDIGAGELDNAIIIMQYASGILANINISRISKNYDQRIEIYGINGNLCTHNQYTHNPYNDPMEVDDTHAPISFPQRYAESYKNELIHFFNVIEKKEPLKVHMNDSVACVRIIEACEKSLKSSTKISVKYDEGFRNYSGQIVKAVKDTYRKARINQTVDYVMRMRKKYLSNMTPMPIKSIFEKLETFIDISDPDLSVPNYFHGLQTAEQIRKDGHPVWLQVVGLIHDIGKIIFTMGCDEDGTSVKEQWGIVGDTFIVGCEIPDVMVYPEFNKENPDMLNDKYNTLLGMYECHCGLENVTCSWGHDEYLYQILKNNTHALPEEALYIIRYHSLYAYHTHGAYKYLANDKDKEMFHWLKLFNKYDLYTKSDDIIIDDATKEYYIKHVRNFIGDELYI